jgi:hypothetical protein
MKRLTVAFSNLLQNDFGHPLPIRCCTNRR